MALFSQQTFTKDIHTAKVNEEGIWSKGALRRGPRLQHKRKWGSVGRISETLMGFSRGKATTSTCSLSLEWKWMRCPQVSPCGQPVRTGLRSRKTAGTERFFIVRVCLCAVFTVVLGNATQGLEVLAHSTTEPHLQPPSGPIGSRNIRTGLTTCSLNPQKLLKENSLGMGPRWAR